MWHSSILHHIATMTARLPPYSTFRTDKTVSLSSLSLSWASSEKIFGKMDMLRLHLKKSCLDVRLPHILKMISSHMHALHIFWVTLQQVMVPQAVSHGNILTFTPKGFKQTLNVKFPDSRLAVCEKCKKNYKTRDSCRVRSGHTTVPWTTAYICITLDDSCTDSAGNYVDKPLTVRMINWQPYCVKELFDDKTPVCAACKKTNRTKSFCRIRHKHRQMPWCTVFVILSTVESTDPSTVVAAPSVPAEFMLSCPNFNDHCTTDNIEAIESSRTFLAKISATESSIHWLRYNNAEGNNSGATESDVKALNDAIRTLGAGAPPPVLDANQQYYQMTQQVIQQQAYMQQPSYGWPYPPSMMPMTVAPSAPSVPQTTEITGTSWGASNGGSGGKESGKDDAKDYKDKGGENTVDAYQQVNGQSTADAYQQVSGHQYFVLILMPRSFISHFCILLLLFYSNKHGKRR